MSRFVLSLSSLIDSSFSLLKFIKRASTQQTGQSTRPCLVIRRHACRPRTESTVITRFPGTSICAWKRRQSMGPQAISSQWWVKTCYHKTTRPPRTSGLCKGRYFINVCTEKASTTNKKAYSGFDVNNRERFARNPTERCGSDWWWI